jgi:GR25 family glycosyltransferase involved in LPS biosynthesis
MKYYLICSDKHPARKAESIAQLEGVGIQDVNFIDSVFLKDYPDDFSDREYIGAKDWMGPGVIGCYTAHLNALRAGLECDEHIMIFEDDVEILLDNILFYETLKFLEGIMESEGAAIIQLNNSGKERGKLLIRNPGRKATAEAYMVNRNFKRFICSAVQEYYGAIDKIYFKLHKDWGLKLYHTIPAIVRQRETDSIIRAVNEDNNCIFRL